MLSRFLILAFAAAASLLIPFAERVDAEGWDLEKCKLVSGVVSPSSGGSSSWTAVCPQKGSYIIKFIVSFVKDSSWVLAIEATCSNGDTITGGGSQPAKRRLLAYTPTERRLLAASPTERRLLTNSPFDSISNGGGFHEMQVFAEETPAESNTSQASYLRTSQSTGGYSLTGLKSASTSGPVPSGIPFSCQCPYDWLIVGFTGTSTDHCTSIQFYCCPPTGVTGDPAFMGFLGQSYQVHGADQTTYNIISTPKLQFNALFTYLNEGECRSGTLCFSHPGNYFGQVGLSLKDENGKTHQLLLIAGSVKEGMKLSFDGEVIEPSQKHLTIDSQQRVYFPTSFELFVETPEFNFKFENSDKFINQQVTVGTQLLTQIKDYNKSLKSSTTDEQTDSSENNKNSQSTSLQSLPHGILGQTWQRKEYPNRWKYIEGQLFDYIVSDGIQGKSFKFNRF